jgi:serine/threonine protein kinase
LLLLLCGVRFCAKGSLYGLLHSPGCYLSWVQVVAMLLDAAKGMEHLHSNSVLHRSVGL